VLPIARSLAELYDSHPGETASRLGRFLMMTVYQGTGISCAMFLTGQASNVLVAGLASRIAGTPITWSSWFVAALVPGLASYIAMPLVVRAVAPPDLVRTPEAAGFARAELAGMGPMGARERMTAVVFGVVCLLWMTTTWHGIEVTVVALLGLGALLLTNAITWEQCLGERAAWDIFVWYGGLLTMGEMLNESGTPAAFAAWVGGWFGGTHWLPIMFVIVGIYFYAHYAFASLTAHALAMFQPFALVLIGLGAPALPTVYALACIVNLSAGLTHYGTTTGPMVFAEGYVTLPDWWKVGFVVSLANLAIWLTVGFLWWKLLGFW
jgi:DASS family divalent anion:Na+ symporter